MGFGSASNKEIVPKINPKEVVQANKSRHRIYEANEIQFDGIVKMTNGGKNNAIGSIMQVLLEVESFTGHLLNLENDDIYGDTFAMMKHM